MVTHLCVYGRCLSMSGGVFCGGYDSDEEGFDEYEMIFNDDY